MMWPCPGPQGPRRPPSRLDREGRAKAAPTAKTPTAKVSKPTRTAKGAASRGPRGVACQRRGAGGPRRARQGGLVAGRWRRSQAHQPRQDAVRGRSDADHQARAHPLLRADRTDDAAPPRRPAAQPAAVPQRRRRARVLAEGHPRHRAGVADPLARDRRRRPRGPSGQRPPARRSRRDAGLARQPGELRDPRLDRAAARAVAADVRLHRHRSRRGHDLGRDPGPGQAVPDRARASRRARLPEDDRQARHPDLDPGRAALPLRRDERLGRARLPGRRVDRPGAHLLGVGEGRAQGPGAARLHAEREHQDARRAVRRPTRTGCARCRRRSPGTSWTTRTCAPTAGRSARSSSA